MGGMSPKVVAREYDWPTVKASLLRQIAVKVVDAPFRPDPYFRLEARRQIAKP